MRPPFLAAAALALSIAAWSVQAQHAHPPTEPDAHAHGADASPADAAVPDTPYATDAALRTHMDAIREAVAELSHHEAGHLAPARVSTLAEDVAGHVRGIIAECELPPDADAALHGVIAPLMEAAQALSAQPGDAAPVARMRAALDEYARRFDHAP